MNEGQIQKIVIIGAGRLASHLGLSFFKQGLEIVQVYNRTPEKAGKLASRIGAACTDNIAELNLHADIYFLAVSDSVIGEIASRLRLNKKLVVHASGTMGMDVLAPISSNFGVFYPVQTFLLNRKINFRKVPICIEANSESIELKLEFLAKKLSRNVCFLNSEKRRYLHLGAVFASNFTNFLYTITEDILISNNVPLELLEPLIFQTAMNVKHGNLFQNQTGPALRGDKKVLDKHCEMLAKHPDYLEIYNLITSKIIKHKMLHGEL